MVIDATRLPNAAASSGVAPAATAQAMAALVLSPAPTMSIGPRTGYAGTRATAAPPGTGVPSTIPRSPQVQKTGRSMRPVKAITIAGTGNSVETPQPRRLSSHSALFG